MPAPLMSREQVLARLLDTFRTSGYDGASLSEISEATGLGKSSLYHHFPGGKEDMARQVLAFLEQQLRDSVFEPLAGAGSPKSKLEKIVRAIDEFYEGGRKACLLEKLCASVDSSRLHEPLARCFGTWLAAIEQVAREAGLAPALARTRAEDFVVRVEGALVVVAGTGDVGVFERTLRQLRTSTLAPP
jgi:TetR/AcrR family transcriptional regulator, lmrAB and yxaGH operons repressor